MAKTPTEKKLLKNIDKFAALEKELQLVFPLKVFSALEDLCKAHLEDSKYDNQSRERVSKLAFVLRQETFKRFGHESLETIVLSKLLRITHTGWAPPPPRVDSITRMRAYPRERRLDAQQEAAAEMIKIVWAAFGRFRFIGARGMEGGGGGGQNLHPLDVMGEETWEHYQKHYIPWYKKAAVISVNRRRYSVGSLTLAAIAFKILVEDYFPEEVDSSYGLIGGTSYRALKVALTAYYEPEVFESFLDKPASSKDTPQDVRSRLKPSAPTVKG